MLINYFLILITLLLVSGLAIDTGMLEWRQVHLQNAADAAAQEGMYQRAHGDTYWSTQAQAQAATNGFTNGSNNVTVNMASPPPSGTYSGDTFAVQATVSQVVPNLFMGLVNGGTSTVAATAIAREIPTCVWIMNPTGNASNGQLWLLSTHLAANCGVYVNTSSGYTLAVDGFAALGSLRTRVVGPASSNASSGSVSPHPRYGASTKLDPLNYVTAPTLTSCAYNNISVSNSTFTLGPSTYCGGVTLTNSIVTLLPGTYIIADGMTMNGCTIYGTSGVTLYFTKKNNASYSNVSIQSSTLYLKAPVNATNGGIPGVLMFADRNWITHGSQGLRLTFNTITSDGFWYLPNTGLYLWQTTFGYYKYNGWIIDNLYQYSNGSTFNSDFSDLGGVSPLRYEDGVLVQ